MEGAGGRRPGLDSFFWYFALLPSLSPPLPPPLCLIPHRRLEPNNHRVPREMRCKSSELAAPRSDRHRRRSASSSTRAIEYVAVLRSPSARDISLTDTAVESCGPSGRAHACFSLLWLVFVMLGPLWPHAWLHASSTSLKRILPLPPQIHKELTVAKAHTPMSSLLHATMNAKAAKTNQVRDSTQALPLLILASPLPPWPPASTLIARAGRTRRGRQELGSVKTHRHCNLGHILPASRKERRLTRL